jgi:hypothetical protein
VLPDWLYGAFNPNDKTNLAPYPGISLLPQFVGRDFRLPQVVRTKPFRKPTIDRREELSTGFELLPSVIPTFEWIRLAQRIPIIVRIENVPNNIKLRAGTTASVPVLGGTNTGGDRFPPVPRALQ